MKRWKLPDTSVSINDFVSAFHKHHVWNYSGSVLQMTSHPSPGWCCLTSPSAQINVMGPAAGQWAVKHAWLIEKSKEIKTIALLNWGARKVMKKRGPRRRSANGKRKVDMRWYYSHYQSLKVLLRSEAWWECCDSPFNLSDFAGAVNLTSDVFPLLLAPRFRVSLKAARTDTRGWKADETLLISPSPHPRPCPDFISAVPADPPDGRIFVPRNFESEPASF